MTKGTSDPLETFDSFVAAFESACKCGSTPDIRAFLPPPGHSLRPEVLCELVRVDLEWKWSLGQRSDLEDYRSVVPELFDEPLALAEAAFEEYRQRCLASEAVDPDDYAQRYHIPTGDWPRPKIAGTKNAKDGSTKDGDSRHALPPALTGNPEVSVNGTVLVAVDVIKPHSSVLPSAGDEFLGFELKRELGRGTFARVFLAKQEALADRPMVLKVSLNLMGEHTKLARLQHAHIVPIYSVHEHENFQAICMPYWGGFTLDRLVTNVKAAKPIPASGQLLSELLSDATVATKERFAAMKHADAIAWIGARLADGLGHAHERGLVHRDLKPANLLLTAEGQPMLLDFNVAHAVDDKSSRAGGSLLYMSPEQLIAYRQRVCFAEAGSDLYSLGLVMYELLTGRHPFPLSRYLESDRISALINARRFPPPPIRVLNPTVSPALEAIVQRMLHPEPSRRYSTARQLQEDLDAHLADRPLPHTRVHSWRERTRKWVRRHPRIMAAGTAAVAVSLFVLAPATVVAVRHRQVANAEALNLFAQSRDDMREAEYLLTVRQAEPHAREAGLKLGREVLNRYGVLADSKWMSQPKLNRLETDDRRRLTHDLGEMMALMVQAGGSDAAESMEVSLKMSERAADCLGDDSPRGLTAQRRRLLLGLGRHDEADRIPFPPMSSGSISDFERLMGAYEQIGECKFRDALAQLEAITQRNSTNYQAWLTAGHCQSELGNYRPAQESFTVCIALRPTSPWPYFNRGTLFIRMGEWSRAISDLDRVLELKPSYADAFVDRAIARQMSKDLKGAEEDLTLALGMADAPTRAYFIRSDVRRKAGNRVGADEDMVAGMGTPPVDQADWIARGLARMETDPKAALADFDAALKNNPRNRDALQNRAHVLAEKLNRTQDAVESLDRLLELYPDFLPALGGRGVYLARLGHTDEARRDANECYRRDRSPFGLYQQASLFGVLAARDSTAKDDAIRLMGEALQSGFADLKLIETDTDMDPVRKDPEFQRLLTAARELHRASKDQRP